MRVLRLIPVALLASSLVGPAGAQETTRFGVVLWGDQANYFRQVWTQGSWANALPDSIGDEWWKPYEDVAEEYVRIGDFHGVTRSGSPVEISVESATRPWGDLYETLLTVRSDGPIEEATFFWSGPASAVQPLDQDTVQIDVGLQRRLAALGDSVFDSVRDSYFRYEEGDTLSARIGSPVGLRVGTTSLLVVVTRVLLDHGGARLDDRGWLFQVVDEGGGRVSTTIFGHPEWAPISRSKVWGLEPVLFFRMEGHTGPLLMARAVGPWERVGFAIIDLRTGRVLSDSY